MKEIETTKKFYGKYSRKLVISYHGDSINTLFYSEMSVIGSKFRKRNVDFRTTNTESWNNYSPNTITLFFNDEQVFHDIKDFVDSLKKENVDELLPIYQKSRSRITLKEYTRPTSNKILEVVESDDKVVVKKDLYHKKYRHTIETKKERGVNNSKSYYHYRYDHPESVKEIETWCKEILVDEYGLTEDEDFKNLITNNYGCFGNKLYFREPQHAMLFKLTFSERIIKSERVIKIDEIKESEVKKETVDEI